MVVSAIAWATNGTLATLAMDEGATVMEVTFYTSVFSALILFPLIALLDPRSLTIKRGDFWPFLAFSLITGTFFAIAWYMCVDMTSVTTAVILLYAYPSIVTISSVFLLREKLNRQKAVALPMTFVGAVLVAGASDITEGLTFDIIGVALGVFTAIAAAIYYIWGKKFLGNYTANTVILYMTILSLPGLFILGNPIALGQASMSLYAWLLIFMLGLVPGTIGFVLSMVALAHIEASTASIVASIEPVAAAAIAFIVLAEQLGTFQVVGVALVFFGVVLLRLTPTAHEGP